MKPRPREEPGFFIARFVLGVCVTVFTQMPVQNSIFVGIGPAPHWLDVRLVLLGQSSRRLRQCLERLHQKSLRL